MVQLLAFGLVANSRGGGYIAAVYGVCVKYTCSSPPTFFVDVASESVWSGVANKQGAFILLERGCLYSTLLMFDANDHCWSLYPSPFS